MKKKMTKFIGLMVIMISVTILITGCDMLPFRPERYNSQIIIQGVEDSRHYKVFSITNDYNDVILDWQGQDEVEEGNLKGTLTGLSGEIELELRIDDQDIVGLSSRFILSAICGEF